VATYAEGDELRQGLNKVQNICAAASGLNLLLSNVRLGFGSSEQDVETDGSCVECLQICSQIERIRSITVAVQAPEKQEIYVFGTLEYSIPKSARRLAIGETISTGIQLRQTN
jgi:predicted metal-binding protein